MFVDFTFICGFHSIFVIKSMSIEWIKEPNTPPNVTSSRNIRSVVKHETSFNEAKSGKKLVRQCLLRFVLFPCYERSATIDSLICRHLELKVLFELVIKTLKGLTKFRNRLWSITDVTQTREDFILPRVALTTIALSIIINYANF